MKEIIEGPAESSSVLPGLPEYKFPHPIAFLVSTILISLFLTSEAARLHAWPSIPGLVLDKKDSAFFPLMKHEEQ